MTDTELDAFAAALEADFGTEISDAVDAYFADIFEEEEGVY